MPRPDPNFGRGARLWWKVSAFSGRRVFRGMWRLEVAGTKPEAPVVYAGNHFSLLDPVLFGSALDPVRFLAVDELFGSNEVFDSFLRWAGAIELTRTRIPLGAMKAALGTLEGGESIALYPEGRRVWTWGETGPKRGAAWLSQRAGVPLVPIAIDGTQEAWGRERRIFRRWPVWLTFCDPIDPADYPPTTAGTRAMMQEWYRRLDTTLRKGRAARGLR